LGSTLWHVIGPPTLSIEEIKVYKHYIRTNKDGEVVLAYSSAFKEQEQGDICVTPDGTDDRHYNLDLFCDGVARHVYKSGRLITRTDAEIDTLAAPAKERATTLARLEELDRTVSRSVEDLYEATKTTPHKAVAAVINEKKGLRERLAQLVK